MKERMIEEITNELKNLDMSIVTVLYQIVCGKKKRGHVWKRNTGKGLKKQSRWQILRS